MDPPTYHATTAATPSSTLSSPPKRSISDLRAQIFAHGTILRPHYQSYVGSDDHIEVIVAKTPALSSRQEAARSTHFLAKQKMNPDGTFDFQSEAASSSEVGECKHYAVLVRRSGKKNRVRVVIKGEPRDSVEEALEWMLEKTEMMMHDMVVKFGEQDDDGCVIM